MNPVINAQLKDFIHANPDQFTKESEYFEVMSIFSVENGLIGENIDPFKAHLSSEEFGIDGLAIIVQGELCNNIEKLDSVISSGKQHSSEFHFFQSKTSEKNDYGDVSKFLDAVFDFFTTQKLVKSEQITELTEIKDKIYLSATKSNPNLKCFYCTTGSGEISELIKQLIENGKSKLEGLNIFNEISIDFYGAKKIQEGYRSATNSNSATINFPKSITLPPHPSIEEAFIGYIEANQILEIALTTEDTDGKRQINRSVFYDNVRDFNPDSEINKSILLDLKKGDIESFVFKNNGVTVVASKINRKGDRFTIEDYQIVNGCQTTNILSLTKDKNNKISVPFRLIGSTDNEFISNVIIGTNKQNEVREDQFWALLPFMKDLEEYSSAQEGDAKIHIERRENQYRNVSLERSRIIKPSDLIKVITAMFFYQPHRAARDYRVIRKELANKIFLENHSPELYHLAALALYKYEYILRTGRIERSKSIYKYYCFYALTRKFWPTPDLLEAPKKSQKKVIDALKSILSDTDEYNSQITKYSNKIHNFVENSGNKNREKVRDYIRSDTVFDIFTSLVVDDK